MVVLQLRGATAAPPPPAAARASCSTQLPQLCSLRVLPAAFRTSEEFMAARGVRTRPQLLLLGVRCKPRPAALGACRCCCRGVLQAHQGVQACVDGVVGTLSNAHPA